MVAEVPKFPLGYRCFFLEFYLAKIPIDDG